MTIHAHPSAAPIARRGGQAGGALTAAGAAALLAHEIKNPMSGIRGAAQLLETNADAEGAGRITPPDPRRGRPRHRFDRPDGGLHRHPGRSRSGRRTSMPSSNMPRRSRVRGFGDNIVFREAYDPSLPAVLGHRDSLVQVLINLLKNAAEAMGERGGTVTLTTAYRHGVRVMTGSGEGRRSLPIEVCVIDDGPGAPAELAEHLFDPFVSSKRAGRGLGLALVEKLVADQGGMVEYARRGARPNAPSSACSCPAHRGNDGRRTRSRHRRRCRDPHRRARGAAPRRPYGRDRRQPRRSAPRAAHLPSAGAGDRCRPARRQRARCRPGADRRASHHAGDRAFGAEHLHDRLARDRAGRVRLSSQAVRPGRAHPRGRRGAGEQRRRDRARGSCRGRGSAADRPVAADAGRLPHDRARRPRTS